MNGGPAYDYNNKITVARHSVIIIIIMYYVYMTHRLDGQEQKTRGSTRQ